jgi:YggT family protein
MEVILGTLDATLSIIRGGFITVAGVLAVVCGVDWLVRSRKINPFGGVARFMRARVDPLIAPIERRVVRAGGLPSSAHHGALVAVVLAGIVLISLLEFMRQQVSFIFYSMSTGPRGVLRLVVSWAFAIVELAIFARVILSWIPMKPGSWIVRWAWKLSEPVLGPLRKVIPSIGMMDITPLVAYFGLSILQPIVMRLL